MPLYEYQCTTCNTRSEVIQSFSAAPLETCSECGGSLKKLISSPAIQFKGSGFYITDYSRSNNGSGSSDGGASGSSDTSATSTSKPDTSAAKVS